MRQGDWGARNMMKLGIAILEARDKLEKERKEKVVPECQNTKYNMYCVSWRSALRTCNLRTVTGILIFSERTQLDGECKH